MRKWSSPRRSFAAAVVRLLPALGEARGDIADLRYEVMYLLRSTDDDAGDRLRDAWSEIGESIVVVGDGGVWNCHIHTDFIGPAIEAGLAVGRPERIETPISSNRPPTRRITVNPCSSRCPSSPPRRSVSLRSGRERGSSSCSARPEPRGWWQAARR